VGINFLNKTDLCSQITKERKSKGKNIPQIKFRYVEPGCHNCETMHRKMAKKIMVKTFP
jgi:hypothetical protein